VYRRLSLKAEKRKKNKRHKRDKDRGNPWSLQRLYEEDTVNAYTKENKTKKTRRKQENRTGISSSARSTLTFVFFIIFFRHWKMKKYGMYIKFLFASKRYTINPLASIACLLIWKYFSKLKCATSIRRSIKWWVVRLMMVIMRYHLIYVAQFFRKHNNWTEAIAYKTATN
jgi:hypothetical protein